jgi:hypothetical protein
MPEENLIKITHGMDRGVVVPVAVSDDTSHDSTPEQKQGLARKEICWNMTKAPKPKKAQENGKYLPDGAAAKAGLNKAILESAWGNQAIYHL